MFRPFYCVLRLIPVLLSATFLGSMPIGMLGLGILLVIHRATGSYADAGAAAGALSLGNAIGLLAQGRLIDRFGPAPVLRTAAIGCPPLLVTLAWAAAAQPVILGLALAAGAALPATVTGMRVLLPRLVPSGSVRAAGYALLGTLFQLAMVLGPLLVSALPLAAVLPGAAALAAGGGLLFAAASGARPGFPDPLRRAAAHRALANPSHHQPADPPALAYPRHHQPADPRTGAPATTHPAHSHRRGVITLVVGGFGGGVATGMLTVGLAAARPGLAGLLFAAFSAGELGGGLVYGARNWGLAARGRLLVGQCGMALVVAVLGAASGNAWLMIPVTVLIGALAAPVSIAGSALLDDVVARGSLGRAYTVLVSAGLVGAAGGNAIAGRTADDARVTVFLAAGALAVVSGWSLSRRRTLSAGRETSMKRYTAPRRSPG